MFSSFQFVYIDELNRIHSKEITSVNKLQSLFRDIQNMKQTQQTQRRISEQYNSSWVTYNIEIPQVPYTSSENILAILTFVVKQHEIVANSPKRKTSDTRVSLIFRPQIRKPMQTKIIYADYIRLDFHQSPEYESPHWVL